MENQVDAEPDEHQRLADATGRFLGAIYPDFAGDMPRALGRLAKAIDEGKARLEISEETNTSLDEILEQD